jgi:hypothetical protein
MEVIVGALAKGDVGKAVGAFFDGLPGMQGVGDMQKTTTYGGGGMDPDDAFVALASGVQAVANAKATVMKDQYKTPADRLRDALNGAVWTEVLWDDEKFGPDTKILCFDGNDGKAYHFHIHFDDDGESVPYMRVVNANGHLDSGWRCIGKPQSQVLNEIYLTLHPQGPTFLGHFPSKENAELSIAPEGPKDGDLWYDTTTDTLKMWSGGTAVDVEMTGSGLSGDLSAPFDVKEWAPAPEPPKPPKKHKHILVTKPPITVSLNGQPVTPLDKIPVATDETLDELGEAVDRRRERSPEGLLSAVQRRRHGVKPHRTDFVIAAQEQGIMRPDDGEPTTLEPSSPTRLAIDVEDDEPVDF